MKKIFGICICLVLLVAACVPGFAMAAATNVSDIIHFLKPTAIVVAGDYMFVSDNIEDGKTAILCFDISNDIPVYKFTHEVNGNITNLSATTKSDEVYLYAVLPNQVDEYVLANNSLVNSGKSYTELGNDVVDFTFGMVGYNLAEYYATKTQLYRKRLTGEGFINAPTDPLNNLMSITAIGDYVYYLYQSNGVTVCKRYNGVENATDDKDIFNSQLNLAEHHSIGTFAWDNDVALFSESNISYVEVGAQICNLTEIHTYDTEQYGNILDVASVHITQDGGSDIYRLYILNDKNQIDVYKGTPTNFTRVEGATIGSDTLDQAIPTAYTSFTLARSNGYPSNIVFMTTDEATSVESIITDATEYIILGYDGDEHSNYYYVLLGDRFGWIKKSNNAIAPIQDSKVEIVDTSVSFDNIQYKAKFNSLNAIYVYELPRANSKETVITQTASSKIEVTVLQQFTEVTNSGIAMLDEPDIDSEGEQPDVNKPSNADNNGTLWYYVSFSYGGTMQKGFVRAESVGHFYITIDLDGVTVVGDRKVNSLVFESVPVYETPDLDPDRVAHDVNENEVKLHSGQRVTVIYENNGVCFIQIVANDGTTSNGYIESARLIDVHQFTTNAIVGLVLVALSFVIAVVLVASYIKRRKRKEANPNEE